MSDFEKVVKLWSDKVTGDIEKLAPMVGLRVLSRLIIRSPVGDPERWKTNASKVSYNRALNELKLKGGGKRLSKKKLSAPSGYTGGRFRGNWQVSIDQGIDTEIDRIDKNGNATLAAGNEVLGTFKVGMRTIYFSNNVPYAYKLETGHSTQAPNGVVGLTAIDAEYMLRDVVRELSRS